jgi:glycosyltransferase involved in cell wall biosynthesis
MTARRRILVVPKWYPWPPERPVFGQFCREHARALATRHDVVVLPSLATPRARFLTYKLEDAEEDGLRTMRVRYRRPFVRAGALAFQLAGMKEALARLRKEGWTPDVIHAHVYQAGFPALSLGRRAGAPVVVTEHYTGLQRGLVTGYERRIARGAFEGAALVAPVSEELAEHVREIAPKARIEVLPNTVDTAVFRPGEGGPGTGRLLTVGALAEKKGHRYLLEAMASLPDVELDLVGGGELDADLRTSAGALGVDGRVRFRGELPKEEVAELMRGADLFVLPSTHETFGAVLIEAMASGLPAVATAVGGVPEVLDEAAGTLVPPRDPAALAEAITAGLARPVDRAALARAAEERYGYDTFAALWSDVYDELL